MIVAHVQDADALETMRRARRNEPGTALVPMTSTRLVDSPDHVIFTSGLGGCHAVALVSHHMDSGKSSVMLAHYADMQANPDLGSEVVTGKPNAYSRAIQRQFAQHPELLSENTRHILITAVDKQATPGGTPPYLLQPFRDALGPDASLEHHHINYDDEPNYSLAFRTAPDGQTVDYAAFGREFGTISFPLA